MTSENHLGPASSLSNRVRRVALRVLCCIGVAAGTAPNTAQSTTPVQAGDQIAGTFGDASGHSGQSHLVYAANARVWWLFTLTSAADTHGGTTHLVKAYHSSGADLATSTWAAAEDSPSPSACGGCFMGSGRALGVAYINNAPTDVIHAEIAMASDGANGLTGHIRATVTATSITWGTWGYHDEPAATWTLPRAVTLGVSTGKDIHSAGPILQQEVDANARRSNNADTGTTWTNGFSNVSVIDNSMINANNSLTFAPLANNAMLAVYDNGGGQSPCYNCGGNGVPEPNLSNLNYKKSNPDGSWPSVPIGSQGLGDGVVFTSDATIDQNDWALVAVNPATIYVFRQTAAGTSVDATAYNPAANAWSSPPVSPPAFGSGQRAKSGAGLFGATDGARIWLFVVNTDVANSILYCKYDGTVWTPWTNVPGTGSGTHSRGFISGFPVAASGQIGLIWTEGTNPYTVFTTSLPTPTGPSTPTATLTVLPDSITQGQSATLTWNTTNATTVTLDQGIGSVAASGTRLVSPSTTTTYTLTAVNSVNAATSTATITVNPPPCTFTLDATSATPSAAAGSGTVGVTASINTCGWTATSNAPTWLTVTSGSSGTGNGTVGFAVSANLTTTPRTGTLTIAGQTFTVTQAGATCSFTLDATSATPSAAAGNGTVGVTASVNTCGWTATSNAPTWLTVTSGSSGTGNGTVAYAVAANLTTTPRTGTLTIAGQVMSITQPGTPSVGTVLIDFNGDGVADTWTYDPTTGEWSITVTGIGVVAAGSWPPGLAVQAVDLDGNGLTDLFGYSAIAGTWLKAVNTGHNSFTTSTGTWWPGWQVSLLDLDGRGQYSVFLDVDGGLMTPLATGIAGESKTRPWLTPDRLRLYFGSTRASAGTRREIFTATRDAATGAFGTPVPVMELNLPTSNAAAPSLTPDELTIVFESDRAGGLGGDDIWLATRSTPTGTFSAPQPLSGINSSSRDGSPELSRDGLSLFFESDRAGGAGNLDIWVATRGAPGLAFASAANFRALNSSGVESHPALSADTQTLYFVSDRAGGESTANIWRVRVRCDAARAMRKSFTTSGGSNSIELTDGSGCWWVAQTTSPWITMTEPASGSGSGTVMMTVAANEGEARTGLISIGGQTITVSQQAVAPPPSAPPTSPPPPPAPPSPPAPAPAPSTSPPPASSPAPPSEPPPSQQPTPPTNLDTPLNLRASVSGSTVVLTWDSPLAGTPPNYLIEAGSRPGASDLAQVVVADRSLTASEVGSGVYMVRVRSLYADHASGASNEIAVVVGGGCSRAPDAPTGLVYSVSGSTVTLAWNAVPGAVISYVVVAGYSPGAANAANSDTGSRYTTLVATGVGNGTYYVRLHARNACGVSGPSNEVAVVVP